MQSESNNEVVMVYDGACPLCRTGARNFCVDEAKDGTLTRIDKRIGGEYPVLGEIDQAKLSLDRGMVIRYQGKLYQGADALYLISQIGVGNHWQARVNRLLFGTPLTARLFYPFLRGARAILVRINGAGPIRG